MRIFLLLLCLTLPAFGATLNVPATYSTVQAAVNAATAGDTVLVASGAYVENILTKASGTSGSPITIDGQGVASIRRFEFDGHDYVHLKNMTVSNYTTAFDASVFFDRNADFNMVSNCIVDCALATSVVGIDFELPASYPFASSDPRNNLICSNEVKNVKGTTMINVYGDFNIILGNRVHSGGSVDFFRCFGQTNTIFGNLCTNSYEFAGVGNHPDFIQTFGNEGPGSQYHLICSNIVLDSVGQFCQLEGNLVPEIGHWTFSHNVVRVQGLGGSCSIPYVSFINNTVYLGNTTNGGNWIDPGMRFYSYTSIHSGNSSYTFLTTPVSSGSIQSASNYIVEGATGLDYITYNGQTRSNGQTFFGVTGTATYTTTGSPTVYPRLENRADNVTIKNNAIANTGNGASNRGWYSVENPSANNSNRLLTAVLTDFNYVGIGASYGTADAGTVTNGYPTSPWWNTGQFYEHNGINGGDPLFVDVDNPLGADGIPWTADDGFQLQEGSPLLSAASDGGNIGAYSEGTGEAGGGSPAISTNNVRSVRVAGFRGLSMEVLPLPAEPQPPITDTFDRADSNPMSSLTTSDGKGIWISGDGQMADVLISGNALFGTGITNGSVLTYPSTISSNHQVTITLGSSVVGAGVRMRVQESDNGACYAVYVASTTSIVTYKIASDGTWTLLNQHIGLPTISAGTTLLVDISGTTTTTIGHTPQGSSRSSVNDSSSPFISGKAGVFLLNSTASISDVTVDDYP